MKQDFLVITQPRSGDEILISKLRSHPLIYITLGNPIVELEKSNHQDINSVLRYKFDVQNRELKREEQEITHRLNTRDYMTEIYTQYFNDVNATEIEKNTVSECIELMYAKNKEERNKGYDKMTEYVCQRYKAYGMTVYMHHLLTDYKELLLQSIEQNSNLKVIILTRSNLLWRYVSSLLPVETNDQGYTKILPTELQINTADFIENVKEIEQQQTSIYDTLSEYGIKPLFITYEGLCKNERLTLDKVQEFLGIPILKDDLFGINTKNIFEQTRPLEAIISNYEVFKQELKNNEYYFYLQNAERDVDPLYYKIRDTTTKEYLDFVRAVYRKEYLPNRLTAT